MRSVFTALLFVWLCFFGAAVMASAAPPAFPPPPPFPTAVPPCGCGCMTGAPCQCKNCCERTADPAWVAARSKAARSVPVSAAPEQWVQVCENGRCRLVKVSAPTPTPSVATPRSSVVQVGDFIYDPASEPSPTPSGGGGSCATGNCGSAGAGAPRQRFHLFGRPHVR